jgi:hypothetical protein
MNPDFSSTGNSVWHQPYIDHLDQNFWSKIDYSSLQSEGDRFLALYPDWIMSSKLNKIKGLDKFNHRFVSLGTTQALDWWHYFCRANNYRIRMFRGEYPYNRDALLEGQWTWERNIDDAELRKGDSVMISLPFSGTGRQHEKWDWLMDKCDELNIPVFVDMAWYGTCWDINVNLNRHCIKQVAFSTTKGLSCGNWRSGIVFSKWDCGSLAIQTEWQHGVHLNCSIANSLMENFTPDTIVKKYKEAHEAVCEHYKFETTNVVHIALAPGKEYHHFNRDEKYNRINIRDAIKRYRKTGEFAE